MNDYIEHIWELPPMRKGLAKQDSDHPLAYNSKVGVEIEGEGLDARIVARKVEEYSLNNLWNIERDGSLRGRNFEAIFRRPFSGYTIWRALSGLQQALESYKGQHSLSFSARTSVHVHINVRDMSFEEITRLMCIYLLFEGSLFNYAGNHRRHSNYCTRMVGDQVTTAFLQTLLRNSLDDTRMLVSDQSAWVLAGGVKEYMVQMSKYSCVNLSLLGVFGTIEFRHHPGAHDASRLYEWINILLCMKKWAMDNQTPVSEIPNQFSGVGVQQFCHEVFGEYANKLIYPDMEADALEGARCIQLAVINLRERKGRRKSRNSLGAKMVQKAKDKRALESKELINSINNSTDKDWIINVYHDADNLRQVREAARDRYLVLDRAPAEPAREDENPMRDEFVEIFREGRAVDFPVGFDQ